MGVRCRATAALTEVRALPQPPREHVGLPSLAKRRGNPRPPPTCGLAIPGPRRSPCRRSAILPGLRWSLRACASLRSWRGIPALPQAFWRACAGLCRLAHPCAASAPSLACPRGSALRRPRSLWSYLPPLPRLQGFRCHNRSLPSLAHCARFPRLPPCASLALRRLRASRWARWRAPLGVTIARGDEPFPLKPSPPETDDACISPGWMVWATGQEGGQTGAAY